MTDTNYLYAQEAEHYYEIQDRMSFPDGSCCGNCENINPCPFDEYEVGICALDDEWVRFEKDPCMRWELAEGIRI